MSSENGGGSADRGARVRWRPYVHQDWHLQKSSHLFRPVHINKLFFVGFFFQIAVVLDSFTVSKGAVYVGKSIVHFLVNLRI